MKYTLTIFIFMFSLISGFSINPMKEYKMKPDNFKINYKEHRLITSDNYELNTWVMRPNKEISKNITIVIIGSDAGNMGFSLPHAFYLLNSGYQVVTFDYRGFGESSEFA